MADTVFERIGERVSLVVRKSSDGKWTDKGRPIPFLSVRRLPNFERHSCVCFTVGGLAFWLAWHRWPASQPFGPSL